MKAFKIMFTAYLLAIVGVFTMCYVGELVFGEDAKYFVIVPALLLGMSARRISQKVVGCTLEQAFSDDNKKS